MGMKGELQKMYHSAEHPQLGIGVNLEHPRSLRDAVSAERKIMKIRCDFKEKYRIPEASHIKHLAGMNSDSHVDVR